MAIKHTRVLADPTVRLPQLLADFIDFIQQDDPGARNIKSAIPTEEWDTSREPHRQWYEVDYSTDD